MAQITLRLSDEEHQKLSTRAHEADMSLNAYVIQMALKAGDTKQFPSRPAQPAMYPPDAYCDNCVQKGTNGGVTSCDRHRSCYHAYRKFTQKENDNGR